MTELSFLQQIADLTTTDWAFISLALIWAFVVKPIIVFGGR